MVGWGQPVHVIYVYICKYIVSEAEESNTEESKVEAKEKAEEKRPDPKREKKRSIGPKKVRQKEQRCRVFGLTTGAQENSCQVLRGNQRPREADHPPPHRIRMRRAPKATQGTRQALASLSLSGWHQGGQKPE